MIPALIIFFLLFLLPFIVLPIGISPFESSKVIVAEIAIELLALVYFYTHPKQIFKILNTLFGKLIFVLLILTVIHLPFQITNNTFFGNAFRREGIFLLWHLIVFSVISGNIKLEHIPKWFYPVPLPGLLLGTLLVGLNLNGRSVGTLGEPNALAATAVFLFPFAFFAYQKNSFKILAFIFTITIILLSGSRSALLALLLEVLLLFLIQKVKFSFVKAFTVCIMLFSLSLYLPFLQGGGLYENRAEIWQTAFYAGSTSPLLGHGFGNATGALQTAAKSLDNNIKYQFVDSSHNFVLDWWIQGGLPGVIMILFMVSYSFRQFIINKRFLEITAFLGIITAMSFNPTSVTVLIAFLWLIGRGFAAS